ncbi:MAG: ImmA/IrrE family metallo-endopeptidase [Verrucomicrobiaceae bacterium]|nr:MAG: ImmA/IrrE family metallo-endopeptidase [Verrucomicrobiaceae bacterium]
MNVRKKHIRKVVEALLDEHHISAAPVPVEEIAERQGATIRQQPTEDSLSGFLFKDRATGTAIIGVNKDHSPTRKRFTVAHELGHLMLHSYEQIHVDKAGYGAGYGLVKLRSDLSSTGLDSEEVEANFFAAEILMPLRLLEEELTKQPTLNMLDESSFNAALKSMSKTFKVSPQALNIRLVQLGLLDVGY